MRITVEYFASFFSHDDEIFDPAAHRFRIIDSRFDREDVVDFRKIFK